MSAEQHICSDRYKTLSIRVTEINSLYVDCLPAYIDPTEIPSTEVGICRIIPHMSAEEQIICDRYGRLSL